MRLKMLNPKKQGGFLDQAETTASPDDVDEAQLARRRILDVSGARQSRGADAHRWPTNRSRNTSPQAGCAEARGARPTGTSGAPWVPANLWEMRQPTTALPTRNQQRRHHSTSTTR